MSNATTMHASGPNVGPHRMYRRSRPRGVSLRASRMVAAYTRSVHAATAGQL